MFETLEKMGLIKAGRAHGFYTHLVPKKIVGSDGVSRIYWVNPAPGSKKKLRLVHHADTDTLGTHLKEIEATHGVPPSGVTRFSKGDSVKVLAGPAGTKGLVGVFRQSLVTATNSTPRASVAVEQHGKMRSLTVNVNNLELVSRATPETLQSIEKKTVEVTTRKGTTTLVNLEDYAKYYDSPVVKKASPAEVLARAVVEVTEGGVYTSPATGHTFKVSQVGADKKGFSFQKYDPVLGEVELEAGLGEVSILEARLKSGEYKRVPPLYTKNHVRAVDAAGGISTAKVDDGKDVTRLVESGGLLEKDLIAFDRAGYPFFKGGEGKAIALQVIYENWRNIERAVRIELSHYKAVDESEISPTDFVDKLSDAVMTYNPFLGPVGKRLEYLAGTITRDRAKVLNDRNKVTLSIQSEVDKAEQGTRGGVITDSKIGGESLTGVGLDMATAPINILDAILAFEGFEDELDLLAWRFGDKPEVVEVLSRWLGIGRYQADLSKKEAAQLLEGHIVSPTTREPYKASTISSDILPRLVKDTVSLFRDEADKYPEFKMTLARNLKLREKFKRQRQLAETGENPVLTGEMPKTEIEREGAKRALLARYAESLNGALVAVGVPAQSIQHAAELYTRIATGQIGPAEYYQTIPKELVRPLATLFRGEAAMQGTSDSEKYNRYDILRIWSQQAGDVASS